MFRRVEWCAVIALCGLVAPRLAAAQDRTSGELVDLIVRAGPQAAAIRAATEVVGREYEARRAHPNPSATYSREGAGFTEFLQVEQALSAFGARAAIARAGAAAAESAAADRDARLWRLRADAAAAVARVLARQAERDVAAAYADDLARVVEILAAREREGEVSRFDRLRVDEERREARQRLAAAVAAFAEARADLQAMLPPGLPLPGISDPLYAPRDVAPLETLLATAETRRPELDALRALIDRTIGESDAARRSRLPSPVVFGGLKRADAGAGRERGVLAGLTLSVPLFDTGARDAARWAAERVRLEAERRALAHGIDAEVRRAAETLAVRQAAVEEDGGAPADELTRIAGVAYREGEIGVLELLDAFRTAARARSRAIEVRFEARLAQIALERAVGDVLWP